LAKRKSMNLNTVVADLPSAASAGFARWFCKGGGMIVARIVAALALATIPVLTSAATPSPEQIKHLEQRLKMMLADIAHKNEQAELSLQPDASGLKTIVRIRVHPDVAGELRRDLTKKVNEYIAIHRGDCRANASMQGVSAYQLNPIRNGVSETIVEYPISTLTGHGNIVTTRMPDGTIVNCGALK
jgi:hypothetical protein